MPQRIPFLVSLTVDDEVVSTQESWHNLRTTLRLAWELAGGIPSAYVGVLYRGRRIAELECTWKGELSEANILAYRRPCHGHAWTSTLVTPLNPNGPIFRGVFAGGPA